MGRNSSLAEEAEGLAPLFVVWQEMHLQHSLSAQDLVAAFILAFASLRRPNAWAAGPLNTSYLPSSPLVESSSIHSLPGLLDLLQPAYLTKKLPHLLPLSNITLYMIFKSLRLYGIKKNSDDYVNVSLLQWYANMRPYTLLFHIPSPIEVRLYNLHLLDMYSCALKSFFCAIKGAANASRWTKSDYDAANKRESFHTTSRQSHVIIGSIYCRDL